MIRVVGISFKRAASQIIPQLAQCPHNLMQDAGGKDCFLKALSQNGIRLNLAVIQYVSVYPNVSLGICWIFIKHRFSQ
jgi:hypothetical protein